MVRHTQHPPSAFSGALSGIPDLAPARGPGTTDTFRACQPMARHEYRCRRLCSRFSLRPVLRARLTRSTLLAGRVIAFPSLDEHRHDFAGEAAQALAPARATP